MAKKMAAGVCKCSHHKWMPGIGFLIAGAVLWYTNNWAYAIIAFGLLSLKGTNCECGCGSCGCNC